MEKEKVTGAEFEAIMNPKPVIEEVPAEEIPAETTEQPAEE